MARYFFNVRYVAGRVRDIEGRELPDIRAARTEATTAAQEMMAEMALRGVPTDDGAFEICDETRAVLLTLPFRDLLNQYRRPVNRP